MQIDRTGEKKTLQTSEKRMGQPFQKNGKSGKETDKMKTAKRNGQNENNKTKQQKETAKNRVPFRTGKIKQKRPENRVYSRNYAILAKENLRNQGIKFLMLLVYLHNLFFFACNFPKNVVLNIE